MSDCSLSQVRVQAGLEVHVLAQGGSDTFPSVASHDSIHVHLLPDT